MTETLRDRDLDYWLGQAESAAGIIRLIVLTPIFPEGLKRWVNPDAKPDERQLDYEASVATGVGVLLAGWELKMDPMTALRSITIVKGTVTLYAMAMRALLIQQGHELVIADATGQRCVVNARRRGSDKWQVFEWNLDRAKAAGLYPGMGQYNNWRTQTKAMLMARASSEASRYVAPDALLGMPAIYEELADGDAESAVRAISAAVPAVDGGDGAAGAQKTAQRRRKPAQPALPAGPPAPPSAPPPSRESLPKIATSQRNRLFGLLRRIGKGDEDHRQEALDLIGSWLEPPRTLESTAELKAPEADLIIEKLEALAKVASEDQSQQGKAGHEPKDEPSSEGAKEEDEQDAAASEREAADAGEPKSGLGPTVYEKPGGEEWPEGTNGASANE